MRLKNKNVILTGASGGIGKHIAHYCDREGANLFLISRLKVQLEHLLSSLVNTYGKSVCFVIDISDAIYKSSKKNELINI